MIVEDEKGNRYSIGEDGTPVPISKEISTTGAVATAAANALDRGANKTAAFFGLMDPEHLASREAQNAPIMEQVQAQHPTASAVGDFLPGMATAMLPGGLSMQVAYGAGEGAITQDPDASAGSRALHALISGAAAYGGGLFGNQMGKVFNSMAERVSGRINESANAIIDPMVAKFKAMGGQVTPGVETGSTALRQLEAGMESNPAFSQLFQETIAHNKKLTNSKWGEAAGLNPALLDAADGRIGEDALAEAQNRLGSVFTRLGETVPDVKLSDPLKQNILGIDQFKKLRKLVDPETGVPFLEKIDQGIITGKEYQVVRSALMDAAASEGGTMSHFITKDGGIVDQLDNAVRPTLKKGQMEAFDKAREQWRNLELLQRPNVLKGGDVSLGMANQKLMQSYGKQYAQGDAAGLLQPETRALIELSKAASSPQIKSIVGNSGTADRLIANETRKSIVGDLASPSKLVRRGVDAAQEKKFKVLYEHLAKSNPHALAALFEDSALGAELGGRAGLMGENAVFSGE